MTDSAARGPGHRPPVARGVRIVGMVILGVIGTAVFALAFGYFVKLLWNWLMPAIFGLGLITYWQAFGIVILGKLIFGNIGGGVHRSQGRHGRGPWDRDREGSREWHGDWRGFWNEEGREAFRRYTERKRAEKSGQGSGSGPESADPVV